jgi:hypothetical protein
MRVGVTSTVTIVSGGYAGSVAVAAVRPVALTELTFPSPSRRDGDDDFAARMAAFEIGEGRRCLA